MQLNASHLLPRPPASETTRGLNHWLLSRLSHLLHGVPVRIVLWDGCAADLSSAPSVAAVHIHDRWTLLRLIRHPTLGFGEGFASGRITVEGDLVRMLEATNRALALRVLPGRTKTSTRNSPSSARKNVHAHYDIGNDFYRLWLDEELAYTCAYYATPDATLEQAQRAKFEYVCRKLDLRPGDRVVEAGCGWGGLALYMARHYGVTVRAYNLSTAQVSFARERAAREGLADRVEFVGEDYRAIDGRYDAFVSVGMLEHVGREQYPELGRVIDRVLDPEHGRGLLHFIGRNVPRHFNAWIAEYIFPGAYAPTLAEVFAGALEPIRMSVIDVENLRLHYARTLAEWLARFEANADRVRAMFDETFVRTWRLYLTSAQAGFLSGELQLFQVVFARAADGTTPMTRERLYRSVDGSL